MTLLTALMLPSIRKRATVLSAIGVALYILGIVVPWLCRLAGFESVSNAYPNVAVMAVVGFYGTVIFYVLTARVAAISRLLLVLACGALIATAETIPLYFHFSTISDMVGGTLLGGVVLLVAMLLDQVTIDWNGKPDFSLHAATDQTTREQSSIRGPLRRSGP